MKIQRAVKPVRGEVQDPQHWASTYPSTGLKKSIWLTVRQHIAIQPACQLPHNPILSDIFSLNFPPENMYWLSQTERRKRVAPHTVSLSCTAMHCAVRYLSCNKERSGLWVLCPQSVFEPCVLLLYGCVHHAHGIQYDTETSLTSSLCQPATQLGTSSDGHSDPVTWLNHSDL